MALGITLVMTLLSVMTYATRVGYETTAEVEDPSFDPEEWMMDLLEEMEQSSPDPEEVTPQGTFVAICYNVWFWVCAEILLIHFGLYWLSRKRGSQQGNSKQC